ncbi:MAG: ABC transporter ATP-binding protein [Spirochaetales bacterium]|nr:ABC transporter ATP-binding protein [Spirochaetales bacterium]
MKTTDPLILFKDFSFQYKSQNAPTLHDINLSVNRGEKVLIIGPSGSGKSTLGSCLNGLIPFSFKGRMGGSAQINGKETSKTGLFPLSQVVGTVLQDTDCQFVGLSVAEDIAFALENSCIPQPEMREIVRKTSLLVDMDRFLDQAPFELSGGQKQRVSLAGVMVDDVDCLLFDEPLANLDPHTGRLAIELIDDIQKKTGKTVIIIEHRLEDVLHRPVNRIILMERGRIVSDTAPDELLASSLLSQKGIREPLYLTALKYAGCPVTGQDNPSSLTAMAKDRFKPALEEWTMREKVSPGTPEGEEILGIRDLSYSYDGDKPVLNDISFSLKKGEMISVLGKNGAGKSTLSKLIMGVITPDRGSISFMGGNLLEKPVNERSRSIGFVMQNPNHMISHSLIREEVGFGLDLRGTAEEERDRRVDDVLKLCGLYPFRNWPIRALSYGQRKRVTIASILVLEPELLILDEPTAGQDYRHYTEIMEFLTDLNSRTGLTIMMVTHDMHLALEYTDRAVVLSEGEMICDNSIARVFSDRDVIVKANLKETSLFTLAEQWDLGNPEDFINRFIAHEKMIRRETRGQQ